MLVEERSARGSSHGSIGFRVWVYPDPTCRVSWGTKG